MSCSKYDQTRNREVVVRRQKPVLESVCTYAYDTDVYMRNALHMVQHLSTRPLDPISNFDNIGDDDSVLKLKSERMETSRD